MFLKHLNTFWEMITYTQKINKIPIKCMSENTLFPVFTPVCIFQIKICFTIIVNIIIVTVNKITRLTVPKINKCTSIHEAHGVENISVTVRS